MSRNSEVQIRYAPCGRDMHAVFDSEFCPWGGAVVINAITLNWAHDVFAGSIIGSGSQVSASDGSEAVIAVSGDLTGPFLQCEGGTVVLLDGWTGTSPRGQFTVVHDGSSDEMVITFGVRRKSSGPWRPPVPIPLRTDGPPGLTGGLYRLEADDDQHREGE